MASSLHASSCVDTLLRRRVFRFSAFLTVFGALASLGQGFFSLSRSLPTGLPTVFLEPSVALVTASVDSSENALPPSSVSPLITNNSSVFTAAAGLSEDEQSVADTTSVDSNILSSSSVAPLSTDDSREDDAVEIIWTTWHEFEQVVKSVFMEPRNFFCKTIEDAVQAFHANSTSSSLVPRIHVNIEVSCLDVFFISGFGTGNYLQAIFMMQMAVRYISIARVKLNITCTDTEEVQWDLILPWYTGVWYSPEYFDSVNAPQEPNLAVRQGPAEPSSAVLPPLSDNVYCGNSYVHPTALMYEEMKYAARRMAVALLGETINGIDQHLAHKIHNFVQQNLYLRDEIDHYESKDSKQSVRLLPGNQQERINATMQLTPIISPNDQFEIDDAVLHVRCGDILSTNAGSYGFLSFPGYSRHISPDVRTIGILTQSFCQEPNASDSSSMKWERQRDADHCLRCQTLTVAFAQFLTEQFPNATVNIRNDPSEPLSLVYARMVLANQTVGCLSTFTIYPVLATFGTGYYLRPTPGYSSSWVTDSQYPVMNSANVDNFELFDDNLLHIPDAKKLWDSQGEEAVIAWLRTGGIAVNNTEA